MVMLAKKTIIAVKIESSYGVDPSPTGADNAIMAYEPDIKINPDMKERYPSNSDISRFPELVGKVRFDIKFTTELKGSGSAGTAPKTSPLFRACGHSETIVSATSVTYAPLSSSWESCTIYFEYDGILYKATGCVGNVEFDFTAGEIPKANWTFKGVYALPTDDSITSPDLGTVVPVAVKGATMTFGSYAAIIEKLMINPNMTVAERPDFNQTYGIKGYQITGRNPEMALAVEAVLRATSNADFLSYFENRDVKALSMVLGATAGNILTVAASYGYLRAPEMADREGVRIWNLPVQLARSSGNDEYSIAFT